ncbi:MAG TPA: hypothetical protein VM056_00025 [Terriglobales bacterium]|nr:hypothetical protein [Terriglobales bacterium]
MTPAKFFHALVLIIVVLPTGIAFANSCPAPPSGNLGRGRYQEWCLQTARGKLIDLGGGNMRCDCGSGSSASAYSTTNNPYTPLVEEFLKFWFMPNSNNKAAQQRKEAMMRELEAQREQARRNQQQAQAARLDSILQRLTAGDMALKGIGDSGGLRLKLGEKRPLGMEVYQHPNDGKKRMGISGLSGINLDNETPTTTRAQLTLKMGDDATRSLQTSSAPPPAATTVAPEPVADPPSSAETNAQQQEVDELARAISQLTPAEQQRLLAAMRAAADDTPAAAASSPDAAAAAPNPGLALKLSGAQTEADALRAAAADPNASPEELSKKASDRFRNLQGVTAEPVKIGQSDSPASAAPPPGPPDPALVERSSGQSSEPDCGRPGTSDVSTVDLRCAKRPLVVDPAKVQPDEVPRPARVQAPEASDLKLLFREKSRWPGPQRPDEPFRNPLREEEIRQIEARLKQRNAEALVSTLNMVALGNEVTPLNRERLSGHFLPLPLKMRYDTNAAFRAQVDKKIDETVREVKRNWAGEDLKAFEQALAEMAPVARRLYPNGLPADGKFSQEFLAERDRIESAMNKRQRENAADTPVHLLIRLDLAFMGIK